MQERTIGPLTVSLVGLGCNNFGKRIDETQTAAVVGAALDAGITLFDTADIYGGGRSEELLGKALGAHRDEVVVATKFGMGDGTTLPAGASAATVQRAADDSLRRLGTDRIDLYQLHQPDDATPIEETLVALDRLVRDGKVLAIGCSNFDGHQIDEAAAVASSQGLTPFVSVQNELSLLERSGEVDLLEACDRHELRILPYYPLASGMLTGKYRRGDDPPPGTRLATAPPERRHRVLSERNIERVEALEAFAGRRGHTVLELAMSWLAGLDHMASVIAGATRPAQVEANVAAVSWRLSDEERQEVDRLTRPT